MQGANDKPESMLPCFQYVNVLARTDCMSSLGLHSFSKNLIYHSSPYNHLGQVSCDASTRQHTTQSINPEDPSTWQVLRRSLASALVLAQLRCSDFILWRQALASFAFVSQSLLPSPCFPHQFIFIEHRDLAGPHKRAMPRLTLKVPQPS